MNDAIRAVLPPPEEYTLEVSVVGRNSSYLVTNSAGSNAFVGFSATKGFKSYMVAFDDTLGSIVYVGTTARSMDERFGGGFGSLDNKNTYSWASYKNRYRLLVWDLSKVVKDKKELEVIEAELTFSARVAQRWWPTGQKSITFHYFRMSKAVQAASMMVTEMIGQYFDVLANRKSLPDDRLQTIKDEKERLIHLLKELSLFRM